MPLPCLIGKQVQNPTLWIQYSMARNEMLGRGKAEPIPGDKLTEVIDEATNEMYLFHGLNYNIVDKVRFVEVLVAPHETLTSKLRYASVGLMRE